MKKSSYSSLLLSLVILLIFCVQGIQAHGQVHDRPTGGGKIGGKPNGSESGDKECGASCTGDNDCKNAADNCTYCISGVCSDGKFCDKKCEKDADCAGAKDGCSVCVDKVCKKTPSVSSSACESCSSLSFPPDPSSSSSSSSSSCVYKATTQFKNSEDYINDGYITKLVDSQPECLKNKLKTAVNDCLKNEKYKNECVDKWTDSQGVVHYSACEGLACAFVAHKFREENSNKLLDNWKELCDESCAGFPNPKVAGGKPCCYRYIACGDVFGLDCYIDCGCYLGEENGMHGRLDECVAEKFVQSFGCTIPKDAWKNQVDFAKKMAEKIKDGSCKSEYCLNESCSKVECKDGLNFCGGINVYYSNTPVSLAWVDDFNPKNEIGVSSFPLNPNEKGKWYIWKGSENKPLLVWDPKDTKSIKDAKQLFGQYTFGKTWRDGFEALASLDKDKDGKVSGMELDGLALWFDKNQDGVSTSAEIKSLEEVGVIALYYTKTGDNTRTGDIIVSKGYTRTDNAGNSITGRAIDWMANKAYSTKDEALKDAAKEKAVRDERQANARTSFGGIWVWSIDNESVTKEMASPVGSFILSEKDGILKGVSASGIALQNSKNINNVVNLSFLEGKRLSKNSNKVKFITIDKNGLKTETTAEISADGSSLTGVSRAEVYLDNKKNKQTAHYTWKAIRNL